MRILLIVIWLTLPLCLYSQDADTVTSSAVKSRPKALKWVAPGLLITMGSITMMDRDADHFFISNYEVREERNEAFMNFSNRTDDYLQHVSSVTTFALSIAGVKGRHSLREQIKLYVKSEALMLATVYTLKYTVGETRPDSGKKNSFPSGHTAQAFTAATFLSKEYGYRSPWITVGAYTAATTVGVFRMLNNRHWVSDVMVGAGIGILSTQIVYLTHRSNKRRQPDASVVSLRPFSAYGSQGASLVVHL